MRATVERGLRHARELLSVKYEEQSAELGQAMEDLHAQICARRQVEALANLFTNAVTFTRQQHTAVIEVGSLEENGMNVVFVRSRLRASDSRRFS